jgi:hypothetical protein
VIRWIKSHDLPAQWRSSLAWGAQIVEKSQIRSIHWQILGQHVKVHPRRFGYRAIFMHDIHHNENHRAKRFEGNCYTLFSRLLEGLDATKKKFNMAEKRMTEAEVCSAFSLQDYLILY